MTDDGCLPPPRPRSTSLRHTASESWPATATLTASPFHAPSLEQLNACLALTQNLDETLRISVVARRIYRFREPLIVTRIAARIHPAHFESGLSHAQHNLSRWRSYFSTPEDICLTGA
ncbi:hypothetical protein LshimejAT787_0200150 [Lyophyllum shimeji]|uniref:Uncharacterized protein n=1 Tax=Lyophyllum shimeji TaxID=47721 RepID=A0A9P3UKG2_LYOSH|nr:hypothetical protein LshimejAT787_0200150 [Lyophyllum shimeji]